MMPVLDTVAVVEFPQASPHAQRKGVTRTYLHNPANPCVPCVQIQMLVLPGGFQVGVGLDPAVCESVPSSILGPLMDLISHPPVTLVPVPCST